ncbi:hypothetical protein F2Q69_00013473 [Brassica cretica]|uniref:Uncharacterized protein n=1 Tax=Brassica cretica TaxID=69181 RepID=A0A8S9QRU1_BRACR|nr:hypothetical protein F2Q69_00013473 [Brassica cretica]
MPKIDVARLIALSPRPKPFENPPDTIRILSDDGEDLMEVDRVPMGRTLRKRKEKMEKHLKRGMIRKKKRNSGRIVRDLEVQIGNVLVPVDFHVLNIKLNWNSSLLLENVFLSTVGVVCNLQSNQLCLTLIDPHINYDPIPVKKSQTSSRRINDPGIIAAYHCGVEYETYYLPSIETHTASSIDSGHQKSTDTPQDELVDSRPDDLENDYYDPIMAVNDAPVEDP